MFSDPFRLNSQKKSFSVQEHPSVLICSFWWVSCSPSSLLETTHPPHVTFRSGPHPWTARENRPDSRPGTLSCTAKAQKTCTSMGHPRFVRSVTLLRPSDVHSTPTPPTPRPAPSVVTKLVGLDRVRLGSQTVVDPNPAALQALERVVDGQPKTPMDTSFQGS